MTSFVERELFIATGYRTVPSTLRQIFSKFLVFWYFTSTKGTQGAARYKIGEKYFPNLTKHPITS